MLDQFGTNLNSLEFALTGQTEQELMEQLNMNVPEMECPSPQVEMQSTNTSPTVSPIWNNAIKNVQSQHNMIVS